MYRNDIINELHSFLLENTPPGYDEIDDLAYQLVNEINSMVDDALLQEIIAPIDNNGTFFMQKL